MRGTTKYSPSPNTLPVTAVNRICTPRSPGPMTPNGESQIRTSNAAIAIATRMTVLVPKSGRSYRMGLNVSAIECALLLPLVDCLHGVLCRKYGDSGPGPAVQSGTVPCTCPEDVRRLGLDEELLEWCGSVRPEPLSTWSPYASRNSAGARRLTWSARKYRYEQKLRERIGSRKHLSGPMVLDLKRLSLDLDKHQIEAMLTWWKTVRRYESVVAGHYRRFGLWRNRECDRWRRRLSNRESPSRFSGFQNDVAPAVSRKLLPEGLSVTGDRRSEFVHES